MRIRNLSQLLMHLCCPQWGIRDSWAPVVPSPPRMASITQSSLNVTYQLRHASMHSSAVENRVKSEYQRSALSFTTVAKVAPSLLSVSQRFEPLYVATTNKEKHTSQLTLLSVTDVSLPKVGINYGLSTRLYQQSQSDSHGTWLTFNKEAISRHQGSWTGRYQLGKGVLSPSVSLILPPLNMKVTPSLVYEVAPLGIRASHQLTQQDDETFISGDTSLGFSWTPSITFKGEINALYRWSLRQKETAWYAPFVWENSLSVQLWDSKLKLFEMGRWDAQTQRFEKLVLSGSLPYASLSMQGSGKLDELSWDLLDANVHIDSAQMHWWKNRISVRTGLSMGYRHVFLDASSSQFSLKFNFSFDIAEFLTLDVALSSVNRGFHRYESFGDVWQDLWRSFDFFGSGRYQSQFTMEAVEVSLVHRMSDWDLHCKYAASVVLSDLEWRWSPTFTIYLQWKVIPEINVDREFNLGR
ncbi:MAG: hypothetical protein ACOXZ4_03275 [Sphaerochaetaceae bacterium]